MLRRILSQALVVLTVCACSSKQPVSDDLRKGSWHASLDLGAEKLPFTFELEVLPNGTQQIHIQNGSERITIEEVERKGDSLFLIMPLFDSEFRASIIGDSVLNGTWINHLQGPDHRMTFSAKAGVFPRFPKAIPERMDPSGMWEVHFSYNTAHSFPAIGVFEQDENGVVTGTFMTETGDFRFLEGSVSGDSLRLSCFDGSHAFLFTALLRNDSLLGLFRSGNHWQQPWLAVKNPDFHLRHPDSLTFIKEGYDMVDFQFPDLAGSMVSPKDKAFRGKPLVIQIMGSWCPNCVDETHLLTELYAKHHAKGLEVLAIGFERHEDTMRAVAALRRFGETLNVEYPILYGGSASKDDASKKLPFLSHVMSYPTTIILDGTGRVRRIHTGIYGPSTGERYTAFKLELEQQLLDLIDEAAVASR